MLENLTLYMTYSELNTIVNKCKNDSDDTACFIFNCDESGLKNESHWGEREASY